MTIQEEGFLAAEVSIYVERHKAAHADVLALARELNKLGQETLRRGSVTGEGLGDVEPLMFLLLVRALSNFQCSILLAESGALVESRTLSRSCLETVFCLAALVRGGEAFIKRMSAALLADRKSTANWILQKPNIRGLFGEADRASLKDFVDDTSSRLNQLRKLGIEEMSREGGLEPLYTWYRQLSGDAAHPTLDALERYLVNGEAGEREIQWGPDCDGEELKWTVLLSCNWLFAGLHAAEEKLGLGLDRNRLGDLWGRFELLSGRSGDG